MMRDALVFLLAAVVIVPISRRWRVNRIVEYPIVGAAVGPLGLKLIREVEGTHRLAEFGIVFMLLSSCYLRLALS